MPRSKQVAKWLGVWLLWSAAAALITACIANFAFAQQPTDASGQLPTTEPPPANAEETPPGQSQGQPLPGQEMPAPESIQTGPATPTPATGGGTEAMPAGAMSAPTDETQIGTAGLPPGFTIPPTASTRDWFNFHDWYTQDDFTLLNHPKDKRNIRLLFDSESLQNQFFTRDLSLGLTSGTRLTVGRIVDCDVPQQQASLEASYEGPFDWSKAYMVNAALPSIYNPPISATVGSLDNALNQFAGGFNGADFYVIKYQSQMNSLEFNYRVRTELGNDQLVYDPDTALWVRRVGNGMTLSWLIGLRDLELDERLNETAERLATFVGPASASDNIRVSNNLAGIQFGGEIDYQYQRFFFAARGGIVPSINFADQKTNIEATDPILGDIGPLGRVAANDGPACVSEFRMEVGYQIRPNVRLRCTYDYLWLTSIALAPNQLALAAPINSRIIVSNDAQFQGVSVGVDVSW
jgi:Putative beta barrel porin-7 (BBP7)